MLGVGTEGEGMNGGTLMLSDLPEAAFDEFISGDPPGVLHRGYFSHREKGGEWCDDNGANLQRGDRVVFRRVASTSSGRAYYSSRGGVTERPNSRTTCLTAVVTHVYRGKGVRSGDYVASFRFVERGGTNVSGFQDCPVTAQEVPGTFDMLADVLVALLSTAELIADPVPHRDSVWDIGSYEPPAVEAIPPGRRPDPLPFPDPNATTTHERWRGWGAFLALAKQEHNCLVVRDEAGVQAGDYVRVLCRDKKRLTVGGNVQYVLTYVHRVVTEGSFLRQGYALALVDFLRTNWRDERGVRRA